MNVFAELGDKQVARLLRAGKVEVIPTDTLYGITTRAENPAAVKRLYAVRDRSLDKACIILIATVSQIESWVAWSPASRELTTKFWPGPVSIVLPSSPEAPAHIPQFKQTIAYRLPADPKLRSFLARTGPLLAPSANPAGKPPATTQQMAQDYFGKQVDFYVEGGDLSVREPSTLIKLDDAGKLVVLRGPHNLPKQPIHPKNHSDVTQNPRSPQGSFS